MLERGSVEGRAVPPRRGAGALARRSPARDAAHRARAARTSSGRTRPQFPGEDAFRFRHLLIRDAAYDALPKSTRAELHERFADWLEERGADLVELDEILGYHLEQAYGYRVELGPAGAAAVALAGGASAWVPRG